MHAIQKKTEECCTHLSSIATQVSVDEHKLQELDSEVELFRADVDGVIESQLQSFRNDMAEVVEVVNGMTAELGEVGRFREHLERSLTETEKLKWKLQYKLVALEERKAKAIGSLAEATREVEVRPSLI